MHSDQTSNAMGYSWDVIDPVSTVFLDLIDQTNPILELGAGNGYFSKMLIEDKHHVIANDLDIASLKKLHSELNDEQKSYLQLESGSFPEEIHFDSASIGAVYSARMIQFLKADLFDEGLKVIHSWLKPNGIICFITLTPFRTFLNEYVDEFHTKKEQGFIWPGEIFDYHQYLSPEYHSSLPKYVNLFDLETIEKALIRNGFEILKSEYLPFQPLKDVFYEKGQLGVIAKKI